MSRNVRDEGVAGSNPATPTSFPRSRIRYGERHGERNRRAVECLVIKQRKAKYPTG